MSVTIRAMTPDEFRHFYQWSIEQQAAELMKEHHISYEAAIQTAAKEVDEMLPDGLHTKHNYLMTIIDAPRGESAGFLWTIHEYAAGKKQSFLCDFAIWESKRRRGYGAAALYLMEKQAIDAGCQESVLFVSDDNTAARALYEKCGYRVLRQSGCGKYMMKPLA